MNSRSASYDVEIDQVEKAEWTEVIKVFHDATIYQTWSYGSVRWSKANLSHLILKERGEIVAASQARIVKLPLVRAGVAYIAWGPLWRVKSRETNFHGLRQMIRALRQEYVEERGLCLRILPGDIDDGSGAVREIFEEEGLRWQPSVRAYKTFGIDLSRSLESIRNGLVGKWRNRLKQAERNNLRIVDGTDYSLYKTFLSIYEEMQERKGFAEFVDPHEFGAIQRDLDETCKMRIMICESRNEPICGLVCSRIGERGIYLLGATSNKGLKSKGSYLLQWRAIEWLKADGCQWYDLGGIDQEENPGGYEFKARLAGKTAEELRHLGQFDMCENMASRLIVRAGDRVRKMERKRKAVMANLSRA
jgi:hypothetical protein